jgi:hypothetical protein
MRIQLIGISEYFNHEERTSNQRFGKSIIHINHWEIKARKILQQEFFTVSTMKNL